VTEGSPFRADEAKSGQTVVLVGLMGAGKTSVGRHLAKRLELPFVDADEEIVRAAGLTVPEIFERFGEQAFRDAERRVIARLLSEDAKVLATGGGAFLDAATREAIARQAVSVWLRADLDVLYGRTVGRRHRPLLNTGDPRATLATLMAARYPVYALADIVVDSVDGPIDQMVERVYAALVDWRFRGEGKIET
jgi:Shikimate kinase